MAWATLVLDTKLKDFKKHLRKMHLKDRRTLKQYTTLIFKVIDAAI